MDISKRRLIERKRRAVRVRKKITGTAQRPRLAIRRSINHIYAQLIDDVDGKTIAHMASTGKEIKEKVSGKNGISKTEVSKIVGELIAEKALEKGVSAIIFDRKGYLYHGRVKALAEAVRSKGLVF